MTAWIERLNADALAHIFHITTETVDISGRGPGVGEIEAAIAISQVCSQWRSQILNLPTIWARLLNFESKILLDRQRNQEILRRSADAPLRIRCIVNDNTENVHSFLLLVADVLDREWHRVQYISIVFDYYAVEGFRNLVLSMHRPAPSLETFEWLADSEEISLTSLIDTTDLFGDDAPMIRNFCYSGGLPPMTMNSQWLSTLKTLRLGIRSPNITDLLRVLERIPLLEILEIEAMYRWHERELAPPSLSQRIQLSHLHVLRLYGWWKTCTDIIDAIDVVALSEMEIEAQCYNLDTNPRMDLQGFGNWFAKLLHSHLSVMPTPSASIKVSKFTDEPLWFDFKFGRYRTTFSDYSYSERQHDIATWFLELLSSFNLDSVTELKFNVDLNLTEIVPHRSHIRDIFCSLSHLTKICAAWKYLTDIRELLSSVNGVFPSLRTIRIPDAMSRFYPDDHHEHAMGILHSFMSWRIEDGRPIEVLELGPKQIIFGFKLDGRYPELEAIPDLKLLIWIQESGDIIEQQIRQ